MVEAISILVCEQMCCKESAINVFDWWLSFGTYKVPVLFADGSRYSTVNGPLNWAVLWPFVWVL